MKFNSYIFAALAAIIACCFWLLVDNTYDSGDSITHYAISRYSWKHPYLLVDNWGKPVFTILSSPFTQLGWKGMTFFNSLVGVVTCCLVAQIIAKLNWKISPYTALLLFFIPNYPLALNSGLTEPLYALILVCSVYFFLSDQYKWSAIVISFLPFVRSEGFISITVLGFIFLFAKKWKEVPYFFVGFVVISVLGFCLHYDSLLWTFNTNPYTINTGFNNYGSGNWDDFFIKYFYMTGIPFTILFWASCIVMLVVLIRKMNRKFSETVLSIESVYLLLFFSFFFAHVVFWKFGLYHSFGMSRVLISILPIGFLIVVYLFNMIYTSWNNKIVISVLCLIIIIFPFVGNKSSWSIPKDFVEDPEMVEMKKIKSEYEIYPEQVDKVYYSSIPLMILLDYDIFGTNKFVGISQLKDSIPANEKILVIRDDWFLNIDCNIKSDDAIFSKLKKVYSKKVSDNNTIEIYTNELSE